MTIEMKDIFVSKRHLNTEEPQLSEYEKFQKEVMTYLDPT